MSIEQEITRLVDAKAAFKSWLTSKGVSVPKDALLPSMVDLLERVPAGGESEPTDITVSNHTTTAFTAYGPDGSVSVPGESDVEMTSVVGGMIQLSCLRKNLCYAAIPGEVISSSASGAYLKITGTPCTVYITVNPIV